MHQAKKWDKPSGNFIVLDLEATCTNRNEFPRDQMEIIEIGAVAVDEELHVIGEFSSFIKPVRHPMLTEFCKELTTIKQSDVDTAKGFVEVAAELAEFAAINEVAWWGSWGDYDRKQLTQDVLFHGTVDPLPQPHHNLKEAFSFSQGLKKQLGLGGAVKLSGLRFNGTAHRGIDDTKNIARILPWIVGDFSVKDNTNFTRKDVEKPRRRK